MSDFRLPQEADELQGSMADGIELPFPVCYFYVKNGNPQAKNEGGVAYFGGWATDYNDAENVLDAIPNVLEPREFVNRDGDSFTVYTIRDLFVAPIAKRECWKDQNGNIVIGKSDKKVRSHLQILSLVGLRDNKKFINLGTHVLSAKGWQGKYVKDALSEWAKATAQVRRESFGNADPKYFWAQLGTFSSEPNFEKVGSGSTSNITPIQVFVPSDLNEENLYKRYVGEDNIKVMVEHYRLAKEWLAEWKDNRKEPQPPDNFDDDVTYDIPDDVF